MRVGDAGAGLSRRLVVYRVLKPLNVFPKSLNYVGLGFCNINYLLSLLCKGCLAMKGIRCQIPVGRSGKRSRQGHRGNQWVPLGLRVGLCGYARD